MKPDKLCMTILFLTAFVVFVGCAPANDVTELMVIEVIDDVPYVYAEDIASALNMEVLLEADLGYVLLRQGHYAYQLKTDSSYVYVDGIRIGYFKDTALLRDDHFLIPPSFLSDYLNLGIVTSAQRSWNTKVDAPAFKIIDHIKFSAEEVMQALDNQSTPEEAPLLYEVLLPTSLSIDFPNVQMELVIDASPITDIFRDILEYNYNYSCFQPLSELTNEDYHTITAARLMDDREIEAAVNLYPELTDAQLETWTYGEYSTFDQRKTLETFMTSLTEEQVVAIERRGIHEADLFHLRKWFHSIDNILMQEDELLIEALTEIYSSKLDVVRQLAEYSTDR
jgi:hypothetical protein